MAKNINVRRFIRNARKISGTLTTLMPAPTNMYFDLDIQTATAGQTTFTTTFPINMVFKNNVLQTKSYTGQGTNTIVFTVPLIEGDEVYLTT